MITKREIDGAIRECEDAPVSYQNCERLATFYTIRDHLFEDDVAEAREIEYSHNAPQIVDDYGDSEFMQAIAGRDPAEMWSVMDELMEAVYVTNPRLYESVMRKLKGQI